MAKSACKMALQLLLWDFGQDKKSIVMSGNFERRTDFVRINDCFGRHLITSNKLSTPDLMSYITPV